MDQMKSVEGGVLARRESPNPSPARRSEEASVNSSTTFDTDPHGLRLSTVSTRSDSI